MRPDNPVVFVIRDDDNVESWKLPMEMEKFVIHVLLVH